MRLSCMFCRVVANTRIWFRKPPLYPFELWGRPVPRTIGEKIAVVQMVCRSFLSAPSRFKLRLLLSPPMNVFVKLRLQLTELLKRPLRQHREVARVRSQDLIAIRLQDALHPPHLLDGLVNLFRCLDHNRQSQQALPDAGLLSNLSEECHSLDQVVSSVFHHDDIQSKTPADLPLRQNIILPGRQVRTEIMGSEDNYHEVNVIGGGRRGNETPVDQKHSTTPLALGPSRTR